MFRHSSRLRWPLPALAAGCGLGHWLRALREGAWLVSLEFPAHEWQPDAVLRDGDGKPVWLYRAPIVAAHSSRSTGLL